jgi:biopolymer transport protein ExbD
MAASNSQRDDFMSDINVTPLVDVMLVLLVIMMVTASYVVTRALKVELPHASSGQSTETPMTIEVDARGAWHLDGKATDEAGLRAALATLRAKNREPSCVIAADGAAAHRNVVRVMDVLRSEAVTKVAIGVSPEP